MLVKLAFVRERLKKKNIQKHLSHDEQRLGGGNIELMGGPPSPRH